MSKLAASNNNMGYFQCFVAGKCQQKTFNATPQYCATFEPDTTAVYLFATQDCWVQFVKSTDTSVASVPADAVKGDSIIVRGGIATFIGLPDLPDSLWRLSIVRDSASGTIDIIEGA